MMEMVDMTDLKSVPFKGDVGSNPTLGTNSNNKQNEYNIYRPSFKRST